MKSSFLSRIQSQMIHMHPAERRLAEFLLNFPGEVASYSASELAKLANVSNATVSRFIQKLDYTNYEDARRHVRTEQKTGAALFLAAAGSGEEGAQAHLDQAQANLASTFAGIPAEEINEVARAMLAARRVWVIGHRSGSSFATYIHWQTFQVVEQISVIPGPGQTLGEYLASFCAQDCVIMFGLRRRVHNESVLLDRIVMSGARMLYITDEAVERLSGPTWHFRCATAAPGPLFSHVSVMAVLHLLATRVIELAGPAGRKRLSAIEQQHEALNEL
ncbi:MAG: MurR/RpiR family transcriptional regulator [Devosia sp.]